MGGKGDIGLGVGVGLGLGDGLCPQAVIRLVFTGEIQLFPVFPQLQASDQRQHGIQTSTKCALSFAWNARMGHGSADNWLLMPPFTVRLHPTVLTVALALELKLVNWRPPGCHLTPIGRLLG